MAEGPGGSEIAESKSRAGVDTWVTEIAEDRQHLEMLTWMCGADECSGALPSVSSPLSGLVLRCSFGQYLLNRSVLQATIHDAPVNRGLKRWQDCWTM
jgi:hypothetical protein